MELRHLRYFDSLARAGSFTRAASLLRVAQPSLSRQIRDLEAEVGAALLVREPWGTRLTVQGESVQRSAAEALRSVDELVAKARLASQGLAGRCRLAVGPVPLLGDRVGAALAAMRKRLPDIELDVRELPSPTHARLLRTFATDVAIGAAPAPSEPGVDVNVFYHDPMDSAAIPLTHRMSTRTHVTTAELRDIPVLVLSRKALPHLMTRTVDALRDRGFTTIRELDNLATINALVIAGQGWALVPRSQRGGRPGDGYRVLPIDDLRLPFVVTLSLRARERSPMVRNVARTLLELCDASPSSAARAAASAAPDSPDAGRFLHLGLELRHLRALVAMLDEPNPGGAAACLGLSQSAMSRRIADLERMLGVDLFTDSERGTLPTHVAELLEQPARNTLAVADAIADRARRARQGVSATIRIGVVSPAMGTIVSPIMAALARECPLLDVMLHTFDTTEQPRALERGAIDVGIAHALRGLLDDAAIDGVQLWDDRIDTILLAADHPLARRPRLRASDLREEAAIFPHPHWNRAFHEELITAFEALGLTPKIVGSYFSLRTMWSLAASGVGWMIGAHSQRGAPPPRLVALPLEGLHIAWGFDLIWRRDETAQHVLDAIRVIRGTPLPHWSELPPARESIEAMRRTAG